MKHYRQFILVWVLVAFSATAFAQRFTLRQWVEDLTKLETQVLEPLTEEFSGKPCEPTVGPYLGAFLDQMKILRGEILSTSYVLLRDIALAAGEALGPLDRHLSCDEINRWQLVESQLRVQIEHTSNVLSQLDSAGAL